MQKTFRRLNWKKWFFNNVIYLHKRSIGDQKYAFLYLSFPFNLVGKRLMVRYKNGWKILWSSTKHRIYKTITPATTLDKIILPIIRRVMPQVIANDIIGIQPMSGPTGQIFSLRARYK